MPLRKTILAAALILSLLLGGALPARAQKSDTLYFAETGHWVSGEFLAAYQAARDPLLVYGYPITDAFDDPLSGLSVQYFQRARFELHPGASRSIQPTPLGSLLQSPGQPVSLAGDRSACRTFAEQPYSVCFAFLAFFDANGGLGQFGVPISDIEQQDNLYVQYFERARFEWHPEAAAGQRVTLSDLGRTYFDQTVGDVRLLEPSTAANLPATPLSLSTHAFTARAVLSPGQKQTIYVTVQDQYLRPVPRASVAVSIHFPRGGEERYRLPQTDASGISRLEFDVGQQPPNQVVTLTVEVTQGGLSAQAGTWFRIWW